MKTITTKATIILLLMAIGISGAFAQKRVEITPFGGYLLGGSVKFYEGKLKINNGASYGGNLAIGMDKGYLIEIGYTRMDSKADWNAYNNYLIQYPDTSIDIATNYLQIGGVRELILDNDAVRPYGTFTLGTSWFHPKTDLGQDEWLFSITAGLGLKYFFSDRVGIRLQASLMLPMIFNGGGFYMGIGTGGASSGVYVSSYSPIVQGNFTGGLIFVLGDTN